MDIQQRMRAVDKKARRTMRNRLKRTEGDIEGVITTLTTQLRAVKGVPLDVDKLYAAAQRDMGLRVRLTNAYRAGDVQAGKRRRQLNDWELDTKPSGPSDAWQEEEGKRRAVGRCDVDAVEKRNKAKRGY
ncbi:hypothetical protein [Pseudomonas phage Misse]|uniref:Uncharacterized protein n=1 Tax=Pseudomonas phage Bertil TaxID=2801385 RepID=A0A7T8IW32_9CAUD|nr:hypothetical protein [Pseudomonas phage Bertil]QQO90817.1 hypothetical protein [Pseudomonas phage Misse]QQO90868.1 hypothetical protein [Pseudomonas phage Strit]